MMFLRNIDKDNSIVMYLREFMFGENEQCIHKRLPLSGDLVVLNEKLPG